MQASSSFSFITITLVSTTMANRPSEVLGEKYPGGVCFLIDPGHSTRHPSLQTEIGSETWVSNDPTSIGDLLLSAVCQRQPVSGPNRVAL